LIAVVLGAVIATLAIGGLAYYMTRSGRLPLQHTAAAKVEPVAPLPTHVMTLEPMLVNLADAGGTAYLRISMTLRVINGTKGAKTKDDESAAGGKDGDAAVAAVRDTALTVLGRQSGRTAGCRWQGAPEVGVEGGVCGEQHGPKGCRCVLY